MRHPSCTLTRTWHLQEGSLESNKVSSRDDISVLMHISARFSLTLERARRGVLWSTTYTGTREALVNAGLATPGQFPVGTKARSSSNGGHPEAGRWYLWQEQPVEDVWSVTYYTDSLFGELDGQELRQLQRHLLNDLQITPESIGDLVKLWRAGMTPAASQRAAGAAGAA